MGPETSSEVRAPRFGEVAAEALRYWEPRRLIFVQYSALRSVWPRRRWVLLIVGIVFGAVLAHFFSMGVFSGPEAM